LSVWAIRIVNDLEVPSCVACNGVGKRCCSECYGAPNSGFHGITPNDSKMFRRCSQAKQIKPSASQDTHRPPGPTVWRTSLGSRTRRNPDVIDQGLPARVEGWNRLAHCVFLPRRLGHPSTSEAVVRIPHAAWRDRLPTSPVGAASSRRKATGSTSTPPSRSRSPPPGSSPRCSTSRPSLVGARRVREEGGGRARQAAPGRGRVQPGRLPELSRCGGEGVPGEAAAGRGGVAAAPLGGPAPLAAPAFKA